MSGDLLTLLHDTIGYHPETILDGIAAADEPLTATVPCGRCHGVKYQVAFFDQMPDGATCQDCHGTGTVRIVAMTEDVLRARLFGAFTPHGTAKVFLNLSAAEADAIVRALLGGAA